MEKTLRSVSPERPGRLKTGDRSRVPMLDEIRARLSKLRDKTEEMRGYL